jgi:hypothetical protein
LNGFMIASTFFMVHAFLANDGPPAPYSSRPKAPVSMSRASLEAPVKRTSGGIPRTNTRDQGQSTSRLLIF